MQYKIIDYRWKKIQIEESYQVFDLQHLQEIEHDENLDLFEKLIQDAVAQGWKPLGAPVFTEGWCKMDTGQPRRMYQAMVFYENSAEKTSHNSTVPAVDVLDESAVITPSIVLPKLIPHPPSTKRVANRSSSAHINLKSPRTTRSERLRQEYLKLHTT
jgi:hypothetical protein